MLGRSPSWGTKWYQRFAAHQDWEALADRPRRPHRQPHRFPEAIWQAIRRVRSELEEAAHEPDTLGYIGAHAIWVRLQAEGIEPLPSVSTIERELRRAGLVKPPRPAEAIVYPTLTPQRPHELIQADILPRSLRGGMEVACFNAIDVVSRYASGRQFERRTAANARAFLWAVWQEQGLPLYQQVDNEDCFSGGHTHPYVLGQVVRLALYCGVQLVFSPVYHPQSNGWVERFHQEYAAFVWNKVHHADLASVRQRSALFFTLYRTNRSHSALQGHSPAELHAAAPGRPLPLGLPLPDKLPLTSGCVHFIRAVDAEHRIKVLNHGWTVPAACPRQGVWVTLQLTPQKALLAVFDAAPDVASRKCLATFDFPLKEAVVPLHPLLAQG